MFPLVTTMKRLQILLLPCLSVVLALAACGPAGLAITQVSSVTCQGQSCSAAIDYTLDRRSALDDYQVDATLDLAVMGRTTLTGSVVDSSSAWDGSSEETLPVWPSGSVPGCVPGDQPATITLVSHDLALVNDGDADEADVTASQSGTISVQCQ